MKNILLAGMFFLLVPFSASANPDKKIVLEVQPTEEEILAMIEANNEKTIVIHIKTENGDKIKEKVKKENQLGDGWYSLTLENKTTDKKWITYFNENDVYFSYLNAEAFLAQTGSGNSANITGKTK